MTTLPDLTSQQEIQIRGWSRIDDNYLVVLIGRQPTYLTNDTLYVRCRHPHMTPWRYAS